MDPIARIILSSLAGVSGQQHDQTTTNREEQQTAQLLTKQAHAAAENGDWQWLSDNEEHIRPLMHPALWSSLVSRTTLNNARNYDAQTADGGRAVIPLSPRNVYERGQLAATNGNIPFYNQTSRPTDATGQAAMPNAAQAVAHVAGGQGPDAPPAMPGQGASFSGLQGVAQTDPSLLGKSYGAMYQRPGMPVPQEAAAPQPAGADDEDPAREPLTVAPMIDQVRQINSTLTQVRDAYPAASPQQPPQPSATQPTTPTSTATNTPRITLPEPRKPQSLSIDIGSTKITRQAVEHTSAGLTASALAQMKQHGLPLQAVFDSLADYTVKAAKKGQPGVKADLEQIHAHQTEQFHSLMAAEQQRLLQSGALDPALAHQAAARYASQQLGGFAPTNFDAVIGYTPEERHTARLNSALSMANMQIDGALKMAVASNNPADLPINALADIVKQTPGLSPDDQHKILIDSAQRLSVQLAPKLIAAGVATQATAPLMAARLAANLTGGQIPSEWKQAVLSAPQALGLSPTATQLYMSDPDRFNVFTAKGMQNLTNAERGNAIALDQLKSVDPEAAAAGLDVLRQQQAASRAPEATISDALRTAGQRNRSIVVEQEGRKTTETTRARETQERKEAVKASIPMLQDAVQAMRDAQRASQGLGGAAKAYIPGTDAYNASKLYTEKIDTYKNAIAKGLFAQSGNLTEKEQKDAAQAFADWWDARFKPKIAEQKVQTLNRLMSKHYGKRIDLNAQDPFNPDAVQPRVYGKDGKQAGKEPAVDSAAPAKPPAGVRLYDKTGKRTQ